MNRNLMAYVNVEVRTRPAGQPASPESIEREQRLSVKAEEIAKLKAVRLATTATSVRTPPRKKSRKHT